RAVDLVGDRLLRRAPRPALHAERLQRVEELLRVDALLLQPLGEHLLVGGVQPLAMDGVEERPVQLVEHAQRSLNTAGTRRNCTSPGSFFSQFSISGSRL